MNSNSNNENEFLNNRQSSANPQDIFKSNPIPMIEQESINTNVSQTVENQQSISNSSSQRMEQQNQATTDKPIKEEHQKDETNSSKMKINLPLEYVDSSIVQPDLTGNNEKVEAKKFKKTVLPIGVLIVVVLVLIFITNSEMNSLFGNSVFEDCPKGWSVSQNKEYCTITTTNQNNGYTDALLVGDVANENKQLVADGKVTFADYSIIKSAIGDKKELNDLQKLIYDLNNDGEVNEKDISDYSNYTSAPRYVCQPKMVLVKGTTKNNGIEVSIATSYVLETNKCREVVKTTKKIVSNRYKNSSNTETDVSSSDQNSTDSSVSSGNTGLNTKVIVVFDAAEGTINGKSKISKSIVMGSTIGDLPDANREGYKFDGWHYGNEKISKNWVVKKSVIVRARFKK